MDDRRKDYGYLCGLVEGIGQKFDDLDHRLFGNGQPGEIGSLKKRLGEVEADLQRRVGAESNSRYSGATLVALGALISGAIQAGVALAQFFASHK